MRIVSVSRLEPRSTQHSTQQMRRRAGDIAMLDTRPDASFVTHLIAMAEHVPHTRNLRRAAVADVDAMYRAANQNRAATPNGMTTQRKA